MDEKLQIEVRNGTEPVEVSLTGDVDVCVEERVIGALTAVAHQEVVVDLSGVRFLDSSGVRALVVGHRASGGAGGSLVLRAPSSAVAHVLQLTGVTDIIEVVS